MKKRSHGKKILYLAMTFVMMVMTTVPSIRVQAAETYTVTFRPGNVAEGFGESLISQYKSTYGEANVEVTKHGAVKIQVAAGTEMPTAPQADQIVYKDGNETKYFMLTDVSSKEKTVTKNQDFVMDYGKLTNGVEYTVQFVDEESEESIAPSVTVYANVGTSVEYTAPATIQTSEYGQYRLVSDNTQKIDELSATASENVLTFSYTNTYDPGTREEEVVIYTDGGTVVDYETVTVGAEGDATVVVQPDGINANGAGGQTDDNTQGVQPDGQEDGNVIIDDEESPLAATPDQIEDVQGGEEQAAERVIIDDEETPLAPGLEDGINPAVIAAIVVGAALICTGGLWVVMKKKRMAEVKEK